MLEKTENTDIQVRTEDLNNRCHSILKNMNPTEINHTLGYNLNATNDNTEVTKALVTKSRKYNEALLKSRLTAKQTRMAIAMFITPALTFPFRGGTLKYEKKIKHLKSLPLYSTTK